MANLETIKSFGQKYGFKPNPNSISTLRSQNQDDEFMDYDESKKGSIFPNNAFEVGKDNTLIAKASIINADAAVKALLVDSLKDLDEATLFSATGNDRNKTTDHTNQNSRN